ncbi:MAG: hypothetical protein R2752_17800 [Vicinamibacterales bacterium]
MLLTAPYPAGSVSVPCSFFPLLVVKSTSTRRPHAYSAICGFASVTFRGDASRVTHPVVGNISNVCRVKMTLSASFAFCAPPMLSSSQMSGVGVPPPAGSR